MWIAIERWLHSIRFDRPWPVDFHYHGYKISASSHPDSSFLPMLSYASRLQAWMAVSRRSPCAANSASLPSPLPWLFWCF
jgi:hypothetical protein